MGPGSRFAWPGRRKIFRIHLASQESLSFLLDDWVKPGHDGRVKSR
jgi:hypothetical protein